MSSKISAAESLALSLTGFFFGVLLLSSALFFCGAESLLPFVLPVAALSGRAWYFLRNRKAPKASLHSLLGYSLVLLLSFGLSALFWENTYDGQTYHWQTFISLMAGWNPLRTLLPDSVPNAIFINHYPKGQEIFAAAANSFFGFDEMGKAATPILAAAAFCYSYALLRRYRSPKQSALLAFLLVANPIIWCQLFTYMPDGLLACSLLLLAGGLFNGYHGRKSGVWMSLFAASILVSLKFTGLVYAVALFGLAGIFYLWRAWGVNKSVFAFASTSVLILLFATFFISANPYATNLARGHHLFHPLMGKESVNIMVGTNAPPSFEHKNRVEKLGLSLFARSGNVHGAAVAPEPVPKIPFTFHPKEWTVFKAPSVLYGGFGPLFSGILLIAVALAFFIFICNRQSGKQLFVFTAATLLVVLINPESWLARYVPHLWLVPLGVLFWAMQNTEAKGAEKVLRRALVVFLLANVLLIGAINTAANAIITYQMRSEYSWLQMNVKQPVPLAERDFISTISRLRRYGIPFVEIKGCEARAICPLPDSAGFKPISSSALLLLPKNLPPYQPAGWFQKLSALVSHAPATTPPARPE